MLLKELFEFENLQEMARVNSDFSGINVIMFVSSKEYVKNKHGPRVKISNIKNTFSENNNFSITISKNPILIAGKCELKKDDFDDICDFIKINYETLMKFWNEEFDDESDFYSKLIKI